MLSYAMSFLVYVFLWHWLFDLHLGITECSFASRAQFLKFILKFSNDTFLISNFVIWTYIPIMELYALTHFTILWQKTHGYFFVLQEKKSTQRFYHNLNYQSQSWKTQKNSITIFTNVTHGMVVSNWLTKSKYFMKII